MHAPAPRRGAADPHVRGPPTPLRPPPCPLPVKPRGAALGAPAARRDARVAVFRAAARAHARTVCAAGSAWLGGSWLGRRQRRAGFLGTFGARGGVALPVGQRRRGERVAKQVGGRAGQDVSSALPQWV